MASYNELNALIDAYINRNGVQAITGQILNGVLKAMVEQLGRGYTIMGAATPTTDPGTPDGPECYFASETGTYTDFDGLQIVPGELALLCYTPSDGWTKETIYEGFQTVQATIDGNVGTPSVGVSYANGVLSFDFHNMKGNPGQNGQDGQDGDPAGFGTIGADITGGVGTPGVTVESSGPATAKNLQFHFTNLKGETGVTSVVATVDNTTGTPTCTVSLVGQQLTLAFSGLKGAQGDTGSSVAYPFTIVNNLTTNDATQALSAAMGVQLEGEITQLEAKVDNINEVVGAVKHSTAITLSSSVAAQNNILDYSTGKWVAKSTGNSAYIVKVVPGRKYIVQTKTNRSCYIAMLAEGEGQAGDDAVFATGASLQNLAMNTTTELTAPVDAVMLYIEATTGNTAHVPTSLVEEYVESSGFSAVSSRLGKLEEDEQIEGEELPVPNTYLSGYIDTNGKITSANDTLFRVYVYPILPNKYYKIYNNNTTGSSKLFAVYSDEVDVGIGGAISSIVGPASNVARDSNYFVIKTDSRAKYLAIQWYNAPSSFSVSNMDEKTMQDVFNKFIEENGRINGLAGRITDIESDLLSYDNLPVYETQDGKYISGSNGNTGSLSMYSIKLADVSALVGKTIKIKGTNVGLSSALPAFGFYSSTSLSSATAVLISEKYVNESFNVDVVVPSTAVFLALVQEYSSESVNFKSEGTYLRSVFEILQDEIRDIEVGDNGVIEFVKSGNSIVFGNLFGAEKIGITIGRGGANNLIDFRNVFLYDADSTIDNPSNVSYLISSVGDMHAPFRFRSDNLTDSVVFTGGNHDYSSVKTAELEFVKFYADGKLLGTDESGKCQSVKIVWANKVKAGNAYASEDPFALREVHTLEYDGIRFNEVVDLQPLVDIRMGLWYGLQLVPIADQDSVMYPGATNRQEYASNVNSSSGDKVCSMTIASNGDYRISMSIDNTFDLGKRDFVTDDNFNGAKHNGTTGKSYFTIISTPYSLVMESGTHYWLRGGYELGIETDE